MIQLEAKMNEQRRASLLPCLLPCAVRSPTPLTRFLSPLGLPCLFKTNPILIHRFVTLASGSTMSAVPTAVTALTALTDL